MEKTPATVVIEEVPVITISQEKYDRLIAAEARLETLNTILRVLPGYMIEEVLDAFFGGLHTPEEPEPTEPEPEASATEATPDA